MLNGRLALAGLSDVDGDVRLPTLVLNVVHPLVPEEIARFCAGKRAVLVVEEGAPDFLEQAIGQILRKADLNTKLHGKDVLPMAGEYTPLVVGKGLSAFCAATAAPRRALEQWIAEVDAQRAEVDKALGAPLPPRPPTFCTGCPERPVFSAMKLLRQRDGAGARRRRHRLPLVRDLPALQPGQFDPRLRHVARLRRGRVGHAGQRGRSASWATAASGTTACITGVAGAVFNKDDSVLIVMNNGYSSATGQQDILSLPRRSRTAAARASTSRRR